MFIGKLLLLLLERTSPNGIEQTHGQKEQLKQKPARTRRNSYCCLWKANECGTQRASKAIVARRVKKITAAQAARSHPRSNRTLSLCNQKHLQPMCAHMMPAAAPQPPAAPSSAPALRLSSCCSSWLKQARAGCTSHSPSPSPSGPAPSTLQTKTRRQQEKETRFVNIYSRGPLHRVCLQLNAHLDTWLGCQL